MNHRILRSAVLLLTLIMTVSCTTTKNATVSTGIEEETVSVKCSTGTFTGIKRNNIETYRGIPYALPPTGKNRWKAPRPVPENDGHYSAFYFGPACPQSQNKTQHIENHPQSEDCLYLNIWSNAENKSKDKNVLVFIHGGSFLYGGTMDPMYDGSSFVKNEDDFIFVSVGYRLGLYGFIDLSSIDEKGEYPDSANLGVLDIIEALKWIKANIASFGGNRDSITLMGQSAGSTLSLIAASQKQSQGLVRRVIAESGSVSLTYSREQCQNLTKALLEKTGCSTMEELAALSEEELKDAVDDVKLKCNYAMRDTALVPEDAYSLFDSATAKGFDLLCGTNAEEVSYWAYSFGPVIYKAAVPAVYSRDTGLLDEEDLRKAEAFSSLMETSHRSPFEAKEEFENEAIFRMGCLKTAELHARNGGKTYVYYWKIPSQRKDVGACHGIELSYVLGNTDETLYTGKKADTALSRKIMDMWASFARSGNPSTAETQWHEFTEQDHNTLIIGTEFREEEDPLKYQRYLLKDFTRYYFNGYFADFLE